MNILRPIRPLFAVACAMGACLSHAALAQPASGPTQGQMLSEEVQKRALTREWDLLRAQVGEQEVTETGKAIERYQSFFEARGSKQPAVAVAISLAIARLYWIELRDKGKALEVYDWTLKQYAAFPGELEPVQRERAALLKAAQSTDIPAAVHITGAGPAAPDAPAAPLAPRGEALAPIRITGATRAAAGALAPIRITAGAAGAANPFAPGAPQVLGAPRPAGSADAHRRAGIVDKIKAGTVSPQAAYANGALTMGEAIELLARMGEADLHQDIAAFVIVQGADRLRNPGAVPLKARLWLGDALVTMRDDRAPRVLESVLSELKPPVKGFSSQWLLFHSIERLAAFHSSTNQHEMAAQTWLRLEPLLGEASWMAPASKLNAALAYGAGSQEAKSRELLARLPGYGVAWLSSLARFDRPRAEAIAAQLIQSRQAVEQAAAQGEARANALALLGYAHRLVGDWKSAQAASDQALKYLQPLTGQAQTRAKDAQALARETLAEAGKRLGAAR